MLEDPGFAELPIEIAHTAAVRELPPHHRDPFDRLVPAAARVESLITVPSDRQFALYGVRLVDATR